MEDYPVSDSINGNDVGSVILFHATEDDTVRRKCLSDE
jgi:hypothetical protein